MRKLLSANFSRLWKDKAFWICIIAMLLLTVACMLNGSRQAILLKQEGYIVELDNYYFMLAPVPGLFQAVFISLFLGTEYSDGSIRNKLIVGHTRTNIYLANMVVCFTAGLCILAAWLIGGLIGIPFFGAWKIGAQGAAAFVLIAVFFSAAFTGIFTILGTLSTNKAATAVAAILLWLGLLILASMAYSRLCEPEFASGVMMTVNGMETLDAAPNPDYVSGAFRTFLEWVVNILPTGQSILMSNMDLSHPVQDIICSTLIALGTTLGGILAFRRKDLK